MKKTVLILAILVCFISYQGFAKGLFEKKPANTPKPDGNSAIEGNIKKINEDIGKINGEIDKIKETLSVPGDGNKPPSQVIPERIPVTPEIVKFLLENDGKYDGLKFYLSEPITLKIYEQNKTPEIEITTNNKVIINPASPPNEKPPIQFTTDNEGTLTTIPGPDKGSELLINFQKEGKVLKFIRNAQLNCYELHSVNDITKDYQINNIPEHIQLFIYGENRRKIEIQAVPVDFAYNQPPSGVNNKAQFSQSRNSGGYNVNYSNVSYNRPVTSSRNVMGIGSLKQPENVIAYVKKYKNLANSDIAIINLYFKEAASEGVNVDIAIAQMLYWTNNLKQRKANHNYGGLKDCSFPRLMKDGMTEGVRAHIQHLKAYARQRPIRELVDPRFSNAWERGFPGITFDQVYPIWSQDSRYGQNIENILRELYRFSGV